MAEVDVGKLIWDDWNREHIFRHQVLDREVYEALNDSNVKFKDGHSGRLLAFGRSGSRILTVVLTPKEDGRHYVVTARDADKHERKIYRGDDNG